jgi:hypothetical protein
MTHSFEFFVEKSNGEPTVHRRQAERPVSEEGFAVAIGESGVFCDLLQII